MRPIHTRKIEVHTYDLGDHRVLVEGKLVDTRMQQGREGTPEPLLIHHLVARIWVDGPDLTISRAEAEMLEVPRLPCREILPGVQKLVGLKIISGFTIKVKSLIGYVRGCAHLTTLFLVLGPAAVQGYFSAYRGKDGKMPVDRHALARVIDSCHVWRKGGDRVRSLLEPQGK